MVCMKHKQITYSRLLRMLGKQCLSRYTLMCLHFFFEQSLGF